MSEFKYLKCVLNESGIDVAGYCRKVMSRGKVTGIVRSLVNVRDLQLEYVRVLHEALLVHALSYNSETMI